MDLVSTILHTKNASEEERQPISATEWLQQMDEFYMTFLLLSCIFTSLVIALSVLHLYYVLKFISNDRIQTDLYYLLFMCPVTALCGVIGMFVPRAATFLYAVALVYLMLCLFITVTLLFNIFGSRKEFSRYLMTTNNMINFRVFPLCCFKCLPSIPGTEKNVRAVEWMVMQSPLLRLILEAANVVVFLEFNHRHHLWFLFSQLLGLISMLVAFYGCYILVPSCSDEVRKYRYGVIFRFVDIVQGLYTIQKFCFDFASNIQVINADKLLSSSAKSQFWTSFMLTWEMLFMSALATYLLRPSKTALFDKYHSNRICHEKTDVDTPRQITHFDTIQ